MVSLLTIKNVVNVSVRISVRVSVSGRVKVRVRVQNPLVVGVLDGNEGGDWKVLVIRPHLQSPPSLIHSLIL